MPKEQEVREVIKRLRKGGWKERSGKESHRVFKKGGVTISVPTSDKEVANGTFKKIKRDAGWE